MTNKEERVKRFIASYKALCIRHQMMFRGDIDAILEILEYDETTFKQEEGYMYSYIGDD